MTKPTIARTARYLSLCSLCFGLLAIPVPAEALARNAWTLGRASGLQDVSAQEPGPEQGEECGGDPKCGRYFLEHADDGGDEDSVDGGEVHGVSLAPAGAMGSGDQERVSASSRSSMAARASASMVGEPRRSASQSPSTA